MKVFWFLLFVWAVAFFTLPQGGELIALAVAGITYAIVNKLFGQHLRQRWKETRVHHTMVRILSTQLWGEQANRNLNK
ncbi:MAG: hypothetical protein ABIH21_00690 [Patescibacteria group bacterium]